VRELSISPQEAGRDHLRAPPASAARTVNIVKFENMAKVKLQAIHYRGAAPALNDIMAATSPDVGELQPRGAARREKKLKCSAPAAPSSRSSGVPTIDESGRPRRHTWFGLRPPAARRAPVVMKINARSEKILAIPRPQRLHGPQMFEVDGKLAGRSFRSISSRKCRAGRRGYGAESRDRVSRAALTRHLCSVILRGCESFDFGRFLRFST